jgi:hypothetical protein
MNNFKENCALLLEDFHYWENRELYVELMERFINGTIDGREFDKEFCQMWAADRDKVDRWEELLYIIDNLKLIQFEDFGSLISDLFTDCDVFEPDPMLREDYEKSEDQLRDCVEKTLLEMKDRYP